MMNKEKKFDRTTNDRVLTIQTEELRVADNKRDDSDEMVIEGYFSVFDSNYEMYDSPTLKISESIDAHAFDKELQANRDVRFLINHDHTLVLGRTKNGTGSLHADKHGLYGTVKVNPNDQDAVNLYERVKRGDVDQCSFGFNILSEDRAETVEDEKSFVHYTIKEVRLHEVSVVTFPAYEQTEVTARSVEFEKQRLLDEKKNELTKKLKGAKENA